MAPGRRRRAAATAVAAAAAAPGAKATTTADMHDAARGGRGRGRGRGCRQTAVEREQVEGRPIPIAIPNPTLRANVTNEPRRRTIDQPVAGPRCSRSSSSNGYLANCTRSRWYSGNPTRHLAPSPSTQLQVQLQLQLPQQPQLTPPSRPLFSSAPSSSPPPLPNRPSPLHRCTAPQWPPTRTCAVPTSVRPPSAVSCRSRKRTPRPPRPQTSSRALTFSPSRPIHRAGQGQVGW